MTFCWVPAKLLRPASQQSGNFKYFQRICFYQSEDNKKNSPKLVLGMNMEDTLDI